MSLTPLCSVLFSVLCSSKQQNMMTATTTSITTTAAKSHKQSNTLHRDELCLLCEKCIRTYDKKKMDMETHVQQFLQEVAGLKEEDRQFIAQVVLGIDQHYKFLKVRHSKILYSQCALID